MTATEALKAGAKILKEAGIENPGLDSSILLADILNTSRAKLFTMGTDNISDDDYIEFQSLIKRRTDGECVAYITGKKEFYGLEFTVNRHVLVPRPETEILVEAVIKGLGVGGWGIKNIGKRIRVLDLCTGSGAIATTLKYQLPQLEVYATDISKEALEIAKINATNILPSNSHIRFYHGDLYNALLPAANSETCYLLPVTCYLIVSNPPYIPSGEIEKLPAEVRGEPRIALDGGEDGLQIIKRIIKEAPNHLEKGGYLLLEADPRQMDEITFLLEKSGFSGIIKYKDLSSRDRVIGGKLL